MLFFNCLLQSKLYFYFKYLLFNSQIGLFCARFREQWLQSALIAELLRIEEFIIIKSCKIVPSIYIAWTRCNLILTPEHFYLQVESDWIEKFFEVSWRMKNIFMNAFFSSKTGMTTSHNYRHPRWNKTVKDQ